MGDPVSEGAYYVTAGHGPGAEVFLVEDGRLEATSQAGRAARFGRIVLAVREAVGWSHPSCGSPSGTTQAHSVRAA